MATRQRNDEKAQGLVEFSLILMFLLLLAFGIMDFARVFHTIITVTAAAGEGARFITRHPNDLNGGRAAATNEAQDAGITLDIDQISATCTDANSNSYCDGGHPAVVTVNYTSTTFMGNLFSVSPFSISRTIQMMVP